MTTIIQHQTNISPARTCAWIFPSSTITMVYRSANALILVMLGLPNLNLSRPRHPGNRTSDDVNRQNIQFNQKLEPPIIRHTSYEYLGTHNNESIGTLITKSWQSLTSQHSLVMRLKGIKNGLHLWMVGTDFCTAFPLMLAAW